MRRCAFLLLGLALFGGAISASEPDKNTKAILDALADAQPPMMAVPQPMPEFKVPPKAADPRARGLGRVKPTKNYDYGRFKAVVGSDGKTRYFPRLAKNIDAGAVTVPYPASIDWSKNAANVLARMYLNDQYGDCVLAGRYHDVGVKTAADTGVGLEADDAEVYAAYQAACGRGDNGCDMSAVNQYQQKVGLKVKGVVHKTDGAISVDHTNRDLVKAAIVVFGGLNIGMSLPNDWYQSANNAVWDITNSRIVGGHETFCFAYDDKYVYTSTWAGIRKITWAAFLSTKWIDECYTNLSPDWYGSDKLAPNGINATDLKADLALIASGQIPPLPDPNPPVPVPPVPVPPVPVPPVPVPPVPGAGYTGNIVTVEVYVNGVWTGKTVSFGTPPTSLEDAVAKHLAGSPQAVIAAVLKLLVDIKANPAAVPADILAVFAAWQASQPKVGVVEPAPAPTGKGERHARREDAEDYYHLVP